MRPSARTIPPAVHFCQEQRERRSLLPFELTGRVIFHVFLILDLVNTFSSVFPVSSNFEFKFLLGDLPDLQAD